MRTYFFYIFSIFCLLLISCNGNKSDNNEKANENTAQTANSPSEEQKSISEIDWSNIPILTNIGDFPFITAPQGIDIYDFSEGEQSKDHITDLFTFKKFEVYNGSGISTVEGKLAILFFIEDRNNGFKYDQYIFDRNVPAYFGKIGAKLLYKGNMPDNEKLKEKLKENTYTGRYQTHELSDDAPFYVYAFQNTNKKYIACLQSNTVSANIFVLELKDFEPSITAYQASDIQKEIETKGKAILYINFDTDKASLKPDGKTVVAEIGKMLKSTTNLNISIEGHTDNTGSVEHNQTLAEQRAQTVYQELVSIGIDKNRMKSKGFGAKNPLVENNSEENKAKNRRVELIKF